MTESQVAHYARPQGADHNHQYIPELTVLLISNCTPVMDCKRYRKD